MKKNYSWWEQNEAVVASFNAWQITGDERYLTTAKEILERIDRYFWDHEKGGYYPHLREDLTPVNSDDRASMWICPYHNTRMCLELIERIEKNALC